MQVDDDKKENTKRKIWLSLRLSLVQKGFTLEAIQEGMVSFLKFLKRQVEGFDFEYLSIDFHYLKHEQNKVQDWHLFDLLGRSSRVQIC